MKKRLLVFFAFISSLTLIGQTPTSLTLRKSWQGPYNIKMTSAPNLQPVFLNPTQAAVGNLLADSLISQNVIQRTGTLLDINNRYKGGLPFNKADFPLSAFLCGDPEVGGCVNGFTFSSTTSCPQKYTYNLLTGIYFAETYSDYDNDNTTFSSSMAQLDIPSGESIKEAYLYWSGNFKGNAPNINLVSGPMNSYTGTGNVFSTSLTSGITNVKLKIPGSNGYQNVTATSTFNSTSGTGYLCVADVSSLLQNTTGGQFWVGNIQSYPMEPISGGSSSGWTLVVIHSDEKPRSVLLWEGLFLVETGTTSLVNVSGLQTPSNGSNTSYIGIGILDGENIASEIVNSGAAPEGIGFQTNNGGQFVDINPFVTDQPGNKLYFKTGYPANCAMSVNKDACGVPLYDANWCTANDGVSCSRITNYNVATDKNGNEITRLPSNRNTLGYDAHHMKLPSGSVAPGATSASITLRSGAQGSLSPFLLYLSTESDVISGIKKDYEINVSIYPNPAQDILNVEIPEQTVNSELRIISTTGVLQKSVQLNAIKQQVNLEGMNQGMYLYEIRQNGERKSGGILQVR